MRDRRRATPGMVNNLLPLLALLPAFALAQVPVDEDGELIGEYEPIVESAGDEDIPLLSDAELAELVGPIALYPDDLLAIVLPAAAYPLQIIEAARFLENLENDPSLKPDPDWDDSVVALVNYPEVVELLNEDIDWTWRLGEAVVAQQGDVVNAIEAFRDRAYAAGNLKSDEYQTVTRDEGIIEITPVSDEVIYVPYYEPERVVVYQPRPVYYYYPRAYPVYYYPYSSSYAFDRGYFWGVTTAFTIGWYTNSLNVYHHSYHGHPYYGYRYWNRWWYRRPTINVYNTTYVRSRSPVTINRYYGGDRWRPRHDRRRYVSDVHVTRTRTFSGNGTTRVDRTTRVRRDDSVQRRDRTYRRRDSARADDVRRNARSERNEPITFRKRPGTVARLSSDDRTYSRDKRQFARRTGSAAAVPATPKVRETRQARADTTSRRSDRQRSAATPRDRQATPAPEVRRPTVQRRESRRAEAPTRSATPRNATPRAERRASVRPDSQRTSERRAPSARQNTERKSAPARQNKERSANSKRNKERRQRR